jgi:hypothetical protein
MKMRVVVVVCIFAAAVMAKCIFCFAPSVYCLMNQAFIFKGFEGSIHGYPVSILQKVLHFRMRKSFPPIQEDMEHLRSNSGFA